MLGLVFGAALLRYAPSLEVPKTIITDVLENLPGPHVTSWEHLHAARHVATFLESLRLLAPPESS